MIAIFHHHRPDGSFLATSPTYPDWRCVTNGKTVDRQTVEASLLDYVQSRSAFAHYEVPLENVDLRDAA